MANLKKVDLSKIIYSKAEIFLGMLLHYEKEKGYKKGWAQINTKKRFGKLSLPPRKYPILIQKPDNECLNWIKEMDRRNRLFLIIRSKKNG